MHESRGLPSIHRLAGPFNKADTMKKLLINKTMTLLLGLLVPLLIIVVMEIIGRFGLTESQLFVPPKVIFETLVDLLKEGELARNLGISFLRVTTGFLLGSALGLIFGVAMGMSRHFEEYVGPLFHGLRQVPVLAWIPLLIISIGIGEEFKIYFIALTAFYPMALCLSLLYTSPSPRDG